MHRNKGIKKGLDLCWKIMMTVSYSYQYVSFKSASQWLRFWKSEFDLVFISSTLISKHPLSHPQSSTTFTLYLYIGTMWILALSKRGKVALQLLFWVRALTVLWQFHVRELVMQTEQGNDITTLFEKKGSRPVYAFLTCCFVLIDCHNVSFCKLTK